MTDMPHRPSRRSFLLSTAAAPLAAAVLRPALASAAADTDTGAAATGTLIQPAAKAGSGSPKKAVLITMLPKGLPIAERFQIGRDAGFEAVEMQTVEDQAEAEAAKAASEKTGLKIHSVMNSAHWKFPISSGDPDVVAKSVAGMETSLRNAKLWGAGTVLLVPAVVDPKTPYADAWTRSQKVIKERLLPLATELKVIIAVEEVWNKFLLSPLEMAKYVDEFNSPWVKSYFDVGNIVFYAYPQDWIRTLNKRIVRVHLKDFKLDRGAGRFEWKNIGEGDIDWVEVRKALADIGYDNYMTTEIEGGDATYLKDVSGRLDRFLAGQKPV
jgi:hexulose-6-phosphate isomerase